MNPEELKLELKNLADNLEGKSKQEIKDALEANAILIDLIDGKNEGYTLPK